MSKLKSFVAWLLLWLSSLHASWQMPDIVAQEKKTLYETFELGKLSINSTPFSNPAMQRILIDRASAHMNYNVEFVNNLDDKTDRYFSIDPFRQIIIINSHIPIKDLASLILAINTITFEKQPTYAASQELQWHLKAIIWHLYNNQGKDHQDASTHIQAYQNLLYTISPDSDTAWVSLSGYSWESLFMKKISSENNLNTIDEILSEEILQKTFESFYEHGALSLQNMEVIKKSINFASLQNELDQSKKSKSLNILTQTEKKVILTILNNVMKSSLNRDITDRTYASTSTPRDIIKTQNISCVWLSILLHQIFSELWINHQWVIFKWHAALIVQLSNKDAYYCDASAQWSQSFYKIQLQPSELWNQRIFLDKDTLSATFGDIENVLMSQALYNITLDKYNYKEDVITKLNYLRFLLTIEPRNHVWWYHLSSTYAELGENKKALDAINASIAIDPYQRIYWYQKTNILWSMKQYGVDFIEAEKQYKDLRKNK